MKLFKFGHFVTGLALSVSIFAVSAGNLLADEAAQSVATGAESLAPSASKIIGTLEFRAEYYGEKGALDTTNCVELGYQFNPDFKINWYQGFITNLYNPEATPAGINSMFEQGFLRTRLSNIWKDDSLSLSYESRIFAPTWQPEIAQGNITRIYNKFTLSRKVNDSFTFSVAEVFMPQIFRTAGTIETGANPWFQNRVGLIADFQLSSKLSLSFPVLYYLTLYRDYMEGAANNNAMGSLVFIWPELSYALTPNVALALAFISDNLFTADLSKVTIGEGLKKGATQLALSLSL
ncbi:MAG: hypothetical protein HY537_05130 [Deltaproteobacteria bacterium]|nr:hypothetical protein [Deltaproteobacteria bacterium]